MLSLQERLLPTAGAIPELMEIGKFTINFRSKGNPFIQGGGTRTGTTGFGTSSYNKSPFDRNKTSSMGGTSNPFGGSASKNPFGSSSDRKPAFGHTSSGKSNPFTRQSTSRSPFENKPKSSFPGTATKSNPFGAARTVSNMSTTSPFRTQNKTNNPFGTKTTSSTFLSKGSSETDILKIYDTMAKNPYGLSKKESTINIGTGYPSQM